MKTFKTSSLLLGLFSVFPSSPVFASEPDSRRDATVAAVDRVMPCVVNIATATIVEYEDFYQGIFRELFGGRIRPRQEQEYSIGSGVI